MAIIATWNVNSVNARLENIKRFLDIKNPDILLLQELKSTEQNFPFDFFYDAGYNVKTFCQKSYNGVAILSKYLIEDTLVGLPGLSEEFQQEARYIEAFIYAEQIPIRLASIYVPNGAEVDSSKFAFKLEFLKALLIHVEKMLQSEDNILLGGDFNVAPEPIDVYDPVALSDHIGFHIKERMALRSILNLGMFDAFRTMHQHSQMFSWWDYRSSSVSRDKGMRIDHLLVSAKIIDIIQEVEMFKEARSWGRPSDHIPVLCKI